MLKGVIFPPAGKYVIAVSGGVDSMVLLDLLYKKKRYELVVAHFNHHLRVNSKKDEALATKTANKLKVEYEVGRASKGAISSEESARDYRYQFLNNVKQKHKAKSIITAHQQDDLIETAAINIVRGTNRAGLTAILMNPDVLRPLINVEKSEIIRYATENNVQWREDETNIQDIYLRNYLRNNVFPRLTKEQRTEFLNNIQKVANTNKNLNNNIATISQQLVVNNTVNRADFNTLPVSVEREVIIWWLRANNFRAYDKVLINRLVKDLKTAKAGTSYPIGKHLKLSLSHEIATIAKTEIIA